MTYLKLLLELLSLLLFLLELTNLAFVQNPSRFTVLDWVVTQIWERTAGARRSTRRGRPRLGRVHSVGGSSSIHARLGNRAAIALLT